MFCLPKLYSFLFQKKLSSRRKIFVDSEQSQYHGIDCGNGKIVKGIEPGNSSSSIEICCRIVTSLRKVNVLYTIKQILEIIDEYSRPCNSYTN